MKKRHKQKHKDAMRKLTYRFLYQYVTNTLLKVEKEEKNI